MSPTQPSLIETSLTDEWVSRKFENKKATIRIGTLFSGIGAIEHALQRLKLKTQIVFAGDIDPYVKDAYFANYDISEKAWHDDVQEFSAKKYKYKVDLLVGDSMKAREKLLWKPRHNLDSLIKDMIQADLKRYGK